MTQNKNKEVIEEALKDMMPGLIDMVSNNRYPVSIVKNIDGSITFIKDGTTWEIDEDTLNNLKLFINMSVLAINAQQKAKSK